MMWNKLAITKCMRNISKFFNVNNETKMTDIRNENLLLAHVTIDHVINESIIAVCIRAYL